MAFCALFFFLVYLFPSILSMPKFPPVTNCLKFKNERRILLELDTKINEMEVQMHGMSMQKPETANKTTDVNVTSYKDKDHILTRDLRHHFQNVKSIINTKHIYASYF